MLASVLIPTFRRPDMLCQAVAALFAGTHWPDEVIIVARRSDSATVTAIGDLQEHPVYGSRITSAWVTVPGHMPPIEAGFKAATGDIIAIIDDDVAVTTRWLEYLLANFAHPEVGVIGGRVVIPGAVEPRLKARRKLGQISWYGKQSVNVGSIAGDQPFEVHNVMEGNSAWRNQVVRALEFDHVLNLDDATQYGLDLCFQARKQGFKIYYDPRALVYHHVAPRSPELDRALRPRRVFMFSRNYTYILLKHQVWWRKWAFLAWWFGIGGRAYWGLGSMLDDIMHHRMQYRHEYLIALAGKVEGIRLWRAYTQRDGK